MGTAARLTPVGERDYLAGERDGEVRHEYVDGVLFAMGGASRAHSPIAANLVVALGSRLGAAAAGRPRRTCKVRLAEGRRYYYPNVVVSCSDARDEPDDYTETRPVLVVEIPSPSTASTDRREKRLAYRSLPSLVDYLIVSRDEAAIERLTRDDEGWTHATFGAGETVEPASIGLTLSMDDIYADVLAPDG